MQANYPGVCFDRLPSNGEQATKLEAIMSLSHFHQLLSKRMWFLIFNLSSLAYLRVSGRLQWSLGVDMYSRDRPFNHERNRMGIGSKLPQVEMT
jgi:hypothetical protein